MELEGFRYAQRQDHHALPYKEYLRAKQLGIDLPEAKPTFSAGPLGGGDPPDPVELVMPKDFALGKCYRFDPDHKGGEENDEANVHLLAALGVPRRTRDERRCVMVPEINWRTAAAETMSRPAAKQLLD